MNGAKSDQVSRLKQLAAINRAITTSLDFNEVLHLIVGNVCELMSAEVCLLLLADNDGRLRIRAAQGINDEEAARFSAPMEEAAFEQLYNLLKLKPDDPLVSVPVVSNQTISGLLAIVPRTQLDAEDEWLLSALADQAAIALNNARLHEMEVAAMERERDSTQEALRENYKYLHVITENVPVYIVYCDQERRYRFVNRGYAERFGAKPADIVGKHIAEVVGEEAYGMFSHHVDAALSGQRVEFEVEIPFRTTGPSYMHAAYVPDFSASGEVQGLIALISDITERKRAEAERENLLAREHEARQQAETASQLKDAFLATLSHELRNPLNSIVGYSQALVRSPEVQQSPPILQAIEVIHRNALAQAQLVSDLLDLSRLQTGKFALNCQPMLLAPAISDALESVREEAAAKQTMLEMDLSTEQLMVDVDVVRVQQILWNLLNNAIKFTPEGGRVLVSLSKDDDQARLVVADTGQGIEPDFLPHVFEMFRQADASSTRRHGGMGIGLALVRQLTELHGGHILAQSPGVGLGSRFTIWLPLYSAPLAEAAVNTSVNPATLSDLRVLVVDDSRDTVEMMKCFLSQEGASVETALSGSDALLLIEERDFDLILCDLSMPEMDGYDLIRNFRARHRLAKVPVIALSGFGRAEDIERSRAAGFSSHLIKPVDFDKLIHVVRQTCSLEQDQPSAK